MKQPEQPGKRARSVLAGNALEIHVAAHDAMDIPNIRDGNSPCVKPQVTTPAAPRPQQGNPNEIVLHTPPVGTAGTVAITDRANQFCFSTEKDLRKHTRWVSHKARFRVAPSKR
jgi:hypothetical protein